MIKSADKGLAVVVRDREDYIKEAKKQTNVGFAESNTIVVL